MKIKLNGNEYGLHWGMPALGEMCEILDITFETCIELIIGAGIHSPFKRAKASAVALLCAIRHYARLNRLEPPDVTVYDLENYADVTDPAELMLVKEDFQQSMINGRKIADILNIPSGASEPVKKKSPSTKKS